MHVMGRIGFIGLGITLAGCLSGAPVFAEDKSAEKPPIEDGPRCDRLKLTADFKIPASGSLKIE